ncbi:MAG TPA: hypothetical protein VJM33_06830 [Microthrixaceae bacterium]|nr:hypothetical protein [Microthrixaceae bacterium]
MTAPCPPLDELGRVTTQLMDRQQRLWGLVGISGELDAEAARYFAVPEDLLGTPIPAHWLGVVLVAGGTARPVTDPHQRGDAVRFAYTLTRSGAQAASIRIEGALRELSDVRGVRGHVVDVAHLLLGLPCAPEPAPVSRLLHLEWLGAICDAAATPELCDLLDDWSFVADLHPHGAPDLADDERSCDWAEAHRRFTRLDLPFANLDADAVARLDGPSFARFVLGRWPPFDELLRRVEIEVSPQVFERLMAALIAAGETSIAPHRGPRARG